MKEIEIRVSPEEAHDNAAILKATAFKVGISEQQIKDLHIIRRSIDARGRDAVFQLRIAYYTDGTSRENRGGGATSRTCTTR